MKWVLIFFLIGADRSSSVTVDFTTKQACQEAIKQIKSKTRSHDRTVTVCVKK